MVPRLRLLTLAGAACLTLMFVGSVCRRLAYPYELEWMTGSVLDHVERIRAGLPIYAAPTTRWIPYLYTPLYYWLAASFTDSFFGCRLLSLAAALVQATCIYRLAHSNTKSRYWAIVATGFFFACFSYTGAWYDLERPDTLCTAIVLVAAVVACEGRSAGAVVASALLVGLGFFAKQQAAVFVFGGALGLLLARRARHALVFAVVSIGAIGLTSAWLDAKSGGWFSFYVFTIPAKHGIRFGLYRSILDYDVLFGVILWAATIVFVIGIGRHPRDRLFASFLAAGALGATSSRLHIGGWINVLQVWTSFACVAVAIVASRIESSLGSGDPRRAKGRGLVLHLALLGQLALWAHDPREARIPGNWPPFGEPSTQGPGPPMASANARFEAYVHALEARGEVLVVSRGHITTPRHFQMAALADVVPVMGPPADLLEAMTHRTLAAILDDARKEGETASPLWPPVMMEDIPALRRALYANYFVAARIDDSLLRIPMGAPAAPRWVYLPRTRREGDLTDRELAVRHAREMGLAAARSASIRAAGDEGLDSIEDLARPDHPRPEPISAPKP